MVQYYTVHTVYTATTRARPAREHGSRTPEGRRLTGQDQARSGPARLAPPRGLAETAAGRDATFCIFCAGEHEQKSSGRDSAETFSNNATSAYPTNSAESAILGATRNRKPSRLARTDSCPWAGSTRACPRVGQRRFA